MIGETISHYRIVEKLGRGGMGVVYKAQDLKLDRLVALKFLPVHAKAEDESTPGSLRERFAREAKAASALDHANIGTIYEIDETKDGQTFIVMAYYEGETLEKRIEAGPLQLDEVLDIALQLATGVAKAHGKGIVHRDIKPANIIVTTDGVVKIIDFGLAMFGDVTRITERGSVVGTVAYMAPEQVRGDSIDVRADVWAMGVVVYEMLTGQRPFRGEHSGAVTHAILNSEPHPPQRLRKDIPPGVTALVDGMLHKDFSRRPNASEVADGLSGRVTEEPRQAAGGRKLTVAAAAVALILVAGMAWLYQRSARISSATEALPEIRRLVDAEDYVGAFALAKEIEDVLPSDEALEEIWPLISIVVSVRTSPPGADVYMKEYAATDGEWHHLGQSPVEELQIPIGLRKWRVEKPGYATVHRLGPISRFEMLDLSLSEESRVPPEMVRIPGGDARTWMAGVDPLNSLSIGDFLMDRHEVTNEEFRAFVDAGGYREEQYWRSGFEAVETFLDATGRPGPSTWQLGDYPEGEDNHPVTGVSWYEAAAYAEFAGKSLPTIYHWAHASGTFLGAYVTAESNFASDGPAAVGSHEGMSLFGTFDMAGNVREWCSNPSRSDRYILGGSWRDPTYMFGFAQARSPLDRSDTNGVRLVRYLEDTRLETARRNIELSNRDYTAERPVSDDVFEVYKERFAYDLAPLNARVELVDESPRDWVAEKITLDAAYGDERIIAHVFRPKSSSPPYQTVVYYPGSGAIWREHFNGRTLVDFVVKGGRALVVPIYKGTYERRSGLQSTWPNMTHGYVDYVTMWVQDLRRTIDYLETRDDIDMERLAYAGVSWGGRLGAIIPAVEDRLKVSILYSGGLASGRSRPEVDQINFVTRVTIPTLMLNGRLDSIEPVETAQLPMLELLGTAPEHKRHVMFDTGHSMPRNSLIRESLDWLDRYLGPVE